MLWILHAPIQNLHHHAYLPKNKNNKMNVHGWTASKTIVICACAYASFECFLFSTTDVCFFFFLPPVFTLTSLTVHTFSADLKCSQAYFLLILCSFFSAFEILNSFFTPQSKCRFITVIHSLPAEVILKAAPT